MEDTISVENYLLAKLAHLLVKIAQAQLNARVASKALDLTQKPAHVI